MSVLLKTDLTEYARQCTQQRRRYAECIQEAQQGSATQAAVGSTGSVTQTVVEALAEPCNFDEGTEQAKQGYLVDLLELSVEPSPWDDKQSIFYDASNGVPEARQWHGDRSKSIQQNVAAATRRTANPVSYSAP